MRKFKEKFSNHPVIFGASLVIAGAIAGYKIYPEMHPENIVIKKSTSVIKRSTDCSKIENLIISKESEKEKKENEVIAASPMQVYPKPENNPNSYYNRKVDELTTLKEHIHSLNEKLIECVSS